MTRSSDLRHKRFVANSIKPGFYSAVGPRYRYFTMPSLMFTHRLDRVTTWKSNSIIFR